MRGTWKTENGISGKCAGYPSAGVAGRPHEQSCLIPATLWTVLARRERIQIQHPVCPCVPCLSFHQSAPGSGWHCTSSSSHLRSTFSFLTLKNEAITWALYLGLLSTEVCIIWEFFHCLEIKSKGKTPLKAIFFPLSRKIWATRHSDWRDSIS